MAAGNFSSSNATASNNGTANVTSDALPSQTQVKVTGNVPSGDVPWNRFSTCKGYSIALGQFYRVYSGLDLHPLFADTYAAPTKVPRYTPGRVTSVVPLHAAYINSSLVAPAMTDRPIAHHKFPVYRLLYIGKTPSPVAVGNFSSPNATVSSNGMANATASAMSNPSHVRLAANSQPCDVLRN